MAIEQDLLHIHPTWCKAWPGDFQRSSVNASNEAMAKGAGFRAIIEGLHHHGLKGRPNGEDGGCDGQMAPIQGRWLATTSKNAPSSDVRSP